MARSHARSDLQFEHLVGRGRRGPASVANFDADVQRNCNVTAVVATDPPCANLDALTRERSPLS